MNDQGGSFNDDKWVFWYDDSPLKGSNPENDLNVKILGEFSTIQDFWGLWRHLNTLEVLPDYSNIRLFRKGILPVWEDPSNTNGGKWILPTVHKEEAVRLWPLLVLMCIGEQFENELDVTGMVLSLTSPSFSHSSSPISAHTPTFQVWTRSGTGPLSLLKDSASSATPSTPSVFLQKLFITNQASISFQPHLMCVEIVRSFAKHAKPKKKKSKHGARGGSTDSATSQRSGDEEDGDDYSRANTPGHPPEDYHFVPISPTRNISSAHNHSPPSSPSPSPSPSLSPVASPTSPSTPGTVKQDLPKYAPIPLSPTGHYNPASPSLPLPNTNPGLFVPPQQRHSPPLGHHPPSSYPRQVTSSPTSYGLHYGSPSPPLSPNKSQTITPPPFSPQRSVSARTISDSSIHISIICLSQSFHLIYPSHPYFLQFRPTISLHYEINKYKLYFSSLCSFLFSPLILDTEDASQSPTRGASSISKLARSASPQQFSSPHPIPSSNLHTSYAHSHYPSSHYSSHSSHYASHATNHPTSYSSNHPTNHYNFASSPPNTYDDPHSEHGAMPGGGGTRPPSRGPTPTTPSSNTRSPSRSTSTSPSFFNRRMQQTKKDELLKKISHSQQSKIEVQEMRHNPLLLQLVSFTSNKKRAGNTIAPTPTRSSSSPQPTPPTSPKVSAQLISSSSSAFAIKKSQEISSDKGMNETAIAKKVDEDDGEVPLRKDLDKIIGSKLKHSLLASQEITWVDLDGGELLDPSKKVHEGGDAELLVKLPLKDTQEIRKPLEEAAESSAHSFSPHDEGNEKDEVVTRDRADSISNELKPGAMDAFGNENGVDDAKYDKVVEDKLEGQDEHLTDTEDTNSTPDSTTTSSSTFYTNTLTNLSSSNSTGTRDPFHTMYNSKYTSYGRDVELRQAKARAPQGAQDIFKKWWLLFCILFVLCIARWFV